MSTAVQSRAGQERRPPPARPDPPSRATRQLGYVLAAAVATMPILTPSGPGNTAFADLAMGAAMVMTTLWLRRRHSRVGVPYLLGVGVLMGAGALAAYHVAAVPAAVTVVQDLFCLLWAAAIANAIRQDTWLLTVFLRAWVWSAVGWAGVLVFGRVAGVDWMAGISPEDGKRAALTFNDPNLAGNYFLCCLCLVLATSVVRHRLARTAAVALILLALLFTGSNGATLGMTLMLGVGAALWLRNRKGITAAIAAVTLTGAVLAAGAPFIDYSSLRHKAADSAQILRDSVGRSNESGGQREILFSEGMALYLGGNPIGVAPGRTKAALRANGAPYVKEAHNDYIATLVERGALGGLGLALLLAAAAMRLGRVARWPQRAEVRELIPRPELLLGLGCAFVVAGFFYEVLHFRHLWAFLGLVAGIDPGWRRAWRR